MQKTLAKVKKLKGSWRSDRAARGAEIEEEMKEEFSPRVRQFVEEREALTKQRRGVRPFFSLPCFPILFTDVAEFVARRVDPSLRCSLGTR